VIVQGVRLGAQGVGGGGVKTLRTGIGFTEAGLTGWLLASKTISGCHSQASFTLCG
jgi:hypothetical protein